MAIDPAERAARASVIDGRIQLKYESLTGGMIPEQRYAKLWDLPVERLRAIAAELEHADPTAAPPDPRRPSTIIEQAVFNYHEERRAKEQAEFDASGPKASVSMDM